MCIILYKFTLNEIKTVINNINKKISLKNILFTTQPAYLLFVIHNIKYNLFVNVLYVANTWQ